MIHYDALAINRNMALDLPFREGAGAITHSVAKTHPLVTIVGAPAPWSILDSHLPFLTLDGATEYLEASAADTLNLDFTSEDYSIGGWFRIDSGGDDDKTLISRFFVSANGWEIYHYTNLILTLRHHHAAGATTRTGAHSPGWAYNIWYFMGVSRSGGSAQFWRGDINGFAALPTTISPGGLINPETCAQNLIIGANTLGATNHYKGGLWRPRVWFERALTEVEWQQIWEKEVEWFRS